MITNEARDLVASYYQWLKEKTEITEVNGVSEITTPLLDRHNDHIQLYLSRHGNRLVLSDDGYTFQDLKLSGFELNSPHRRAIAASILTSFGITNRSGELLIEVSAASFPQRKHNLLQAILAINDLAYMARPSQKGIFLQDVQTFLSGNNIRFVSSVKLSGKSHFDHYFDFVIPPTPATNTPERIIKTFNNPDRNSISLMAFSWDDTRNERAPNSKAYAILNDHTSPIKSDLISALTEYNILPVPWADRERALPDFAA